MTPAQSMLNATLTGYVTGLAWGAYSDGPARNPYTCIQMEAHNWQHGFEQGRDHFYKVVEADLCGSQPKQSLADLGQMVCESWGFRWRN